MTTVRIWAIILLIVGAPVVFPENISVKELNVPAKENMHC
jgi:hypothetical protein